MAQVNINKEENNGNILITCQNCGKYLPHYIYLCTLNDAEKRLEISKLFKDLKSKNLKNNYDICCLIYISQVISHFVQNNIPKPKIII